MSYIKWIIRVFIIIRLTYLSYLLRKNVIQQALMVLEQSVNAIILKHHLGILINNTNCIMYQQKTYFSRNYFISRVNNMRWRCYYKWGNILRFHNRTLQWCCNNTALRLSCHLRSCRCKSNCFYKCITFQLNLLNRYRK